MRKYKLTFGYDGSSYFGYQKQKSHISVQEDLERAILKVVKHEASTTVSGRTDRGVHANNQIATFISNTNLPIKKLFSHLKRALPDSIILNNVEVVDSSFHPRRDAIKRAYIYKIMSKDDKNIINYRFFTFIDNFDRDLFKTAMNLFVGKHNFKYFSTKVPKEYSFEKTIFSIDYFEGSSFDIKIVGDSFLRSMIRIMLGSAISIAKGEKPLSFITEALKNPEMRERKIKADPNGLYLDRVFY